MIDVRLIRNQPDVVRAALARRGSPELAEQLEQAVAADVRLREIVAERDGIRARVNEVSKQVGALRKAGDADQAEQLQTRSRALGEDERLLAAESETVKARLRDLLLRIPNLPHPEAPDGDRKSVV